MRPFRLLGIALLAIAPVTTQASIGESYGFGSRMAALGGIRVTGEFDGTAAATNPAGLPFSAGGKRLAVSWGFLVMEPRFLPISDITITNTFTSDSVQTGSVDVDYRTTAGQAFGLTYTVSEWNRITLGLATYLPINQIAYVDTGEPYLPEYVLYRARTQRPEASLAVGGELGGGFSVGAGIRIGFGVTATANTLIKTKEDEASTMRFNATMKPKASPYLGVLFTSQEAHQFSAGATIRFAMTNESIMAVNAGTRLAPIPKMDFRFTSTSALAYDPLAVELGSSWNFTPELKTSLQLGYEAWGSFRSPVSVLTNEPGGSFSLAGGEPPSYETRNILVPRVGQELALGPATTLRLGYAFRPSILKEPPAKAGNALDPSKHMLSAGLGLDFPHFLAFAVPCRVDLHLAYHRLVSQHVAKSDPEVGAPGYDVGGKILGGGLSLNLAI